MPAPVSSNAVVSPTIVVKGDNTALSFDCDDADGHTITEAEWYKGADPGVGNGEACSLGPGTDWATERLVLLDPERTAEKQRRQ
jgi:hypothetical protein